MSRLKLLSAGLIAAAIIAGPAMGHERHLGSHHAAAVARYAPEDVFAAARNARSCIPAPRVGAFASDPWANETPCEPGSGY
jgi:hypothetical protein